MSERDRRAERRRHTDRPGGRLQWHGCDQLGLRDDREQRRICIESNFFCAGKIRAIDGHARAGRATEGSKIRDGRPQTAQA